MVKKLAKIGDVKMKMKKINLVMAFFVLNFFTAGAYAQEGVIVAPAGDLVTEGAAVVSEENVPYVKPGNVTVNFKEADIRAILNYLSEVSGVDIVPAPNVSGPVTLKLTDKPWEVALDIVVKNYGYAYDREGDIIRVVTLDSLQKEELSTEVVSLNYATAETAQNAVKDMLTERGKLTYDSRTNSLVITDLATNIYKIRQVIEQVDTRTPQVMIEARILETLLENDEKMGIDWTMKIAAIGASRPTTLPFANEGWRDLLPHAIERFLPFGQTGTESGVPLGGGSDLVTTTGTADYPLPGAGLTTAFPFVDTAAFTYGTLDFSQFQAVLELLKKRRRTEVVSNPRITTLNNEEAKILVGRVYNFPLFDQAEDTGKWTISGYEAKELGIKLLVTPQVNENNEIVVALKPEIKNYLGLEKISEELSAPLWSTREADTNVMVKDGDTIFIGGLIKENTVNIEKKVPLLGDIFGDIPFIGGLVKHKALDTEKTELIFFVTVHIVKDVRALTKIATRDVTEIEFTPDINEDTFVEIPPPVETPPPAAKKKRKPFIDFGKKKK